MVFPSDGSTSRMGFYHIRVRQGGFRNRIMQRRLLRKWGFSPKGIINLEG